MWLSQNLQRMTDEGHRVLIFSQWTRVLDVIEDVLEVLSAWTRDRRRRRRARDAAVS